VLGGVAVMWLSLPAGSSVGAAQTSTADSWGPAVDGVQLRIMPAPAQPGPTPTSPALPELRGQLRNQGHDVVSFVAEAVGYPSVEIDGVWYSEVRAGSCCSGAQLVPAGSSSGEISIRFDPRHIYSLETPPRKLALRSGPHTIRLRTFSSAPMIYIRGSAGRDLTLLSNPITIDVPDVPPAVERQALVDVVSRGGDAAWDAVPTLVEKYPAAALSAIEAGIRATPSEWIRGMLVSFLGDIQGDDVTAFLRRTLRADVDFPSRVSAATILSRRGDPIALPAAMSIWAEIQPTLAAPLSDGTRDAVGGVISILARSGDADAIDALARRLADDPIDVRMAAVKVFLPESHHVVTSGRAIGLNGGPAQLPGGTAGIAIQRLLLAALDDTGTQTGVQGTYDEVAYQEPRVCDMAALVFAKRWPDKYRFQWSASTTARDAQIAIIRALLK